MFTNINKKWIRIKKKFDYIGGNKINVYSYN